MTIDRNQRCRVETIGKPRQTPLNIRSVQCTQRVVTFSLIGFVSICNFIKVNTSQESFDIHTHRKRKITFHNFEVCNGWHCLVRTHKCGT